MNGSPIVAAMAAAACRPLARARVQRMVDVKEVDRETVPRRYLGEPHRESCRIAAARERHDPRAPRTERELGGEAGVESLKHHASADSLLEPESTGTQNRQRRSGRVVEEIGVAGDQRGRAGGQGCGEDRFVIRVAKHDGGAQVRLRFDKVHREGREDLGDERLRQADLVAQRALELGEDLPADDEFVLREDQAEKVAAQAARGVGGDQTRWRRRRPSRMSRKMSSSVRFRAPRQKGITRRRCARNSTSVKLAPDHRRSAVARQCRSRLRPALRAVPELLEERMRAPGSRTEGES